MKNIQNLADTLNHLVKYGKNTDVSFVARDGLKQLAAVQAELAALVAVAEAASKLNWTETNPFRGDQEAAPYRVALGKVLANLAAVREGGAK